MAWTVSKTQMIVGNKRAVSLDCLADAATANLETGLAYIEGMTIGYKSCATGPQYIYPNSGSGGTALAGVLGCSGFTSGDVLTVLVYGRS